VFTRTAFIPMFDRHFDRLLDRRAARLARFLSPRLPETGTLLDIGSGTGHNAHALRGIYGRSIAETDVVDIHTVGPGPVIGDGKRLPFSDSEFAGAMLLFVLHYVPDPAALLREAARVGSGRVWVLQTSCSNAVGRCLWSTRDWFTGRLAFRFARLCGYVSAPRCPLRPAEYFTRDRLLRLYSDAGMRMTTTCRFDGLGAWTTRDWDTLEREAT
jgi:SAM-dependent methyltransferase